MRAGENLLTLCDQLHHATNGAFDPTIQPLWHAHAFGGDVEAARALVGWRRLALPTPMQRGLHLDAGQALSFNGIAQGAATDAVRDSLKASGLTRVMIDIGEVATLGGPWRIGLSDPTAGHFATLKLKDMALAVSSPAALRLGAGAYHILASQGRFAPALVKRWPWPRGLPLSRTGFPQRAVSCARQSLQRCARQLPQVHQVLVGPWAGERACHFRSRFEMRTAVQKLSHERGVDNSRFRASGRMLPLWPVRPTAEEQKCQFWSSGFRPAEEKIAGSEEFAGTCKLLIWRRKL